MPRPRSRRRSWRSPFGRSGRGCAFARVRIAPPRLKPVCSDKAPDIEQDVDLAGLEAGHFDLDVQLEQLGQLEPQGIRNPVARADSAPSSRPHGIQTPLIAPFYTWRNSGLAPEPGFWIPLSGNG
jgi:hypothetical protein